MGACNLVDANISTWMPCLQETAFFGSPLLMALAGYLIIALIMFKYNLPGQFALPMGLLFTFGLYAANPLPQTLLLVLVGLIVAFAWVALALKNKFTRW